MKSEDKAKDFIVKADECYAAGCYQEALENFNRCLLFAPSNSKFLSAAFEGRAVVYYEVKQFKKSLANIQCAIHESVCTLDTKRFKELQEKCCKSLSTGSCSKNILATESFFTLSHPKHEKIPYIADCLHVLENSLYGRYIVTTKDLNTGDIVIVEEPFYKVLDKKMRHARCAICLRQNMLNLFPCSICSDGEFCFSNNSIYFLYLRLPLAMFCSKRCSESTVHKFECNQTNDESFDELLLKRMFYQAIEITGSLENLKELMEKLTPNKTIMDYDLSDSKDQKEKLMAMMCLDMHEHPEKAKFDRVIEELVKTAGDEKMKKFLRNYLMKCLQSQTVNFFHFLWSSEQREGQGFALCSMAAFLLHSCDPNVDKIDVDNKFVFVVKKPIQVGEQLFLGYDRYSFLTHSLVERQEYFNNVYSFHCRCDACKNDYPKQQELFKFDQTYVDFKLRDDSVEAAKEQLKQNCNYIQNNMVKYPCFEVCTMMGQNFELLHVIGNRFPF